MTTAGLGCRQGQELPDAVGVCLTPRAVGYDAQLQQSRQSLINFLTTHAQSFSQAPAAVERGAVSIGGQSKQDQYGCSLGAQAGEPAVVQQAILKPAEVAGGLSDEIGSGWRDGRLLTHALRFW